jgi:hypothetical protein
MIVKSQVGRALLPSLYASRISYSVVVSRVHYSLAMASEIKGNDNAMFCRRPVGRGVESWRHPHAWEDLELSSMPNKELSFWQPRVVSAGHPVGGKNHSFHGSRGCLTFGPPILKDLTNYNTIFSSEPHFPLFSLAKGTEVYICLLELTI